MLLRSERAAVVRSAIRRLPDRQRATLILRVYHEMPHERIAGVLGSSVGAVKANFFHTQAYDAVDEVLDIRQQARFGLFEEMIDPRKLDLLMRAQNAAARKGTIQP
jgi:hypothetical protein